jgi:glycosyltransferase involved in cell wall biosynthesis
MRIAHVISSLDPSMGGLPKSAVAQAAAQSLLGHETCLVYFEGSDSSLNLAEAYSPFPGFERIQLIPLKGKGLLKLLSSDLVKALKSFRPDILHTHGLWEPLLAHAQRFGLKHHIPFVVFPQSMLHPWQAQNHRVAKWILMVGLGWKRRWEKAAFIQVLSDEEAKHWIALGIEHTQKIPNGIFASEDAGSTEYLPYPWANKSFILSLARLHPQKSPDVLLEAFANISSEFPSLCLVLAGPDYGLKEKLKDRSKELGLEDRIFLPGSLRGNEKWSSLHACRCFCLPSRAEGFSLALI